MSVRRLSLAVVAMAGAVLVSGGCAADRVTAPEQGGERFHIRGSSLTPNGQRPLMIVDGVVWTEANLSGIAPEDIDRIEVLKGPAAVRIYGSAARDGVIVISTKGSPPSR